MRGRPILGVIAGLVFGLFLGPTLWLWGVIPLASPLMWILPIAGIVLGLAIAAWAPFGSGAAASTGDAAPSPADADPAPPTADEEE